MRLVGIHHPVDVVRQTVLGVPVVGGDQELAPVNRHPLGHLGAGVEMEAADVLPGVEGVGVEMGPVGPVGEPEAVPLAVDRQPAELHLARGGVEGDRPLVGEGLEVVDGHVHLVTPTVGESLGRGVDLVLVHVDVPEVVPGGKPALEGGIVGGEDVALPVDALEALRAAHDVALHGAGDTLATADLEAADQRPVGQGRGGQGEDEGETEEGRDHGGADGGHGELPGSERSAAEGALHGKGRAAGDPNGTGELEPSGPDPADAR